MMLVCMEVPQLNRGAVMVMIYMRDVHSIGINLGMRTSRRWRR